MKEDTDDGCRTFSFGPCELWENVRLCLISKRIRESRQQISLNYEKKSIFPLDTQDLKCVPFFINSNRQVTQQDGTISINSKTENPKH